MLAERLPSPTREVSATHLEFRCVGSTVVVSDLRSTNGTTVNNAPVQEWQLADGDVIHPHHMPPTLQTAEASGSIVAGDLKSNALEAYFSRPITPWSYLLGRTGAFTAYLLLVTLAPLLWIWTFDVMTGPDGHFDKISMVPLGMAAAMTLLALTVALFIQALATFTRSGTATAHDPLAKSPGLWTKPSMRA